MNSFRFTGQKGHSLALAATLMLGIAAGGVARAAEGAADPAKTRELVAVVQSSADLAARARACQQLTIVGTEEAVPALAGLLGDERLSHYAREALEAMPYPAAAEAMRAALGTLKGPLLVGVVNSLGMRRDKLAVPPLTRIAQDAGSGAAAEAMLALGRIAAPESVPVLQRLVEFSPDATLRAAAAEACLLVANDHVRSGRRQPAITLYDFVRRARVPDALHTAALYAGILARGPGDLSLLIEHLRSSEAAARDTALLATRELRGSDVTRMLMTEMGNASPTVQALIVFALVERNDAQALPTIEGAAKSASEEVRLSALKALGGMGGDSSVAVLLQAVRAPAGPADAATALASLARIKAATANAAILKLLPAVEPAVRVKLIGVLGDRRAEAAIGELISLAKGAEPESAKAALRALALVARPADQAALIGLAVELRDEEMKTLADRAVATAAMKVLETERRADAVMAAFRAATDPGTKASLLRPLGAIVRSMGTSHEAFFAVRAALGDKAEPVREAALRCLADWPDAAPAVTLLEFAARADAPPALREAALNGALRLAGNVAAGRDRSPLDVLTFFRDASRLVRTKAEKLMLVGGLGGVKQFEAVQLLQPYLDDPAAQTEAALALVQIAPAVMKPPHGDEVKRLLEKIAATENDEDTKRKAGRIAKGLPVGAGKQKAAAVGTPAAAAPKTGAHPLFNGADLAGWFGNPGVWRVRDGTIVGGSLEGNPRNEFLATARPSRNFGLKLEYKLNGTEGFINGGVQFRSVRVAQPPNEMSGYQADIGAGHSGCLYDESRRKQFLARGADEQIKRLEKAGDWNRYEIRCQGSHIELWLNGEKTVDYHESDATLAQEGLIALQIHGNCKAEIAFRNVVLEELP